MENVEWNFFINFYAMTISDILLNCVVIYIVEIDVLLDLNDNGNFDHISRTFELT